MHKPFKLKFSRLMMIVVMLFVFLGMVGVTASH